ncbi:MAG: hypothetical protein IKY83_08455 [Proteobacteria bacterium]|nr:hypothetical protein [Pseudomonadota bacterium]
MKPQKDARFASMSASSIGSFKKSLARSPGVPLIAAKKTEASEKGIDLGAVIHACAPHDLSLLITKKGDFWREKSPFGGLYHLYQVRDFGFNPWKIRNPSTVTGL